LPRSQQQEHDDSDGDATSNQGTHVRLDRGPQKPSSLLRLAAADVSTVPALAGFRACLRSRRVERRRSGCNRRSSPRGSTRAFPAPSWTPDSNGGSGGLFIEG
jgi:hypothetical protein